MKTEPAIERLIEALSDIRKKMDDQIRRAQVEYVENVFQEQRAAVGDCLDGIDRQLIKLSVYIEEYQRLHGGLNELNETIRSLGEAPLEVPEAITGDGLAAILTERIDYLKSRGKI